MVKKRKKTSSDIDEEEGQFITIGGSPCKVAPPSVHRIYRGENPPKPKVKDSRKKK